MGRVVFRATGATTGAGVDTGTGGICAAFGAGMGFSVRALFGAGESLGAGAAMALHSIASSLGLIPPATLKGQHKIIQCQHFETAILRVNNAPFLSQSR